MGAAPISAISDFCLATTGRYCQRFNVDVVYAPEARKLSVRVFPSLSTAFREFGLRNDRVRIFKRTPDALNFSLRLVGFGVGRSLGRASAKASDGEGGDLSKIRPLAVGRVFSPRASGFNVLPRRACNGRFNFAFVKRATVLLCRFLPFGSRRWEIDRVRRERRRRRACFRVQWARRPWGRGAGRNVRKKRRSLFSLAA